MTRPQFHTLIEQHRVNLIKLLVARKFSLADASDVLHSVVLRILDRKSYLKIAADKESHKGYNFLRTSTLNAAVDFHRTQQRESTLFAATGTKEDDPDSISLFLDTAVEPTDEVECPFCFQGPLNKFGACFRCGTIVGTNKAVKRVSVRIDEVGYDSSIHTAVDVRNAISLLSDYEQLVVTQIIDGNESLTSMSDVSDKTRKTLWRTWVRAKGKLQKILVAYDTRPKSVAKAA